MRTTLLAIAAVALLVASCGNLSGGPAAPRPNVIVSAENAPANIVVGPAVLDDFVVPATGSVRAVSVRGWRRTLTAGYQSALPTAGSSGRQLELISADLSFAPAAVSAQFGTAAVIGAIRFKARLLDATGKELGSFAGTAQAREANASASEAGMTDNASKTVEALYEALATELLSKS